MKEILCAIKDEEAKKQIADILKDTYHIDFATNKETSVNKFKKKKYDLLFIDIEFLTATIERPIKEYYIDEIQEFFNIIPAIGIIVFASQSNTRKAVYAVRGGASDYINYPIEKGELKLVVDSILETHRRDEELDYLRDQFWQNEQSSIIKTKSPKVKEVLSKLTAVAPTISTVLLTGETGTGKGEMAKLIHKHSNRKDGPFIAIHCGAIPDTLLESELFGHEKGAFTGAQEKKIGKFEIAKGGTIFLDEIGTISYQAQIKLLQVLQDKIFTRIGGTGEIKTDVRIITATNIDLKKLSENGKFRTDLYYRINIFPLEIPPLRLRKEDIPSLISCFLERLNSRSAKTIKKYHPQVLEACVDYSWPGNIRELENMIERSYILENSDTLRPENLPIELFPSHNLKTETKLNTQIPLNMLREKATDDIEKQYIKEILDETKGKIALASQKAQLTTRQFYNLMQKHQINKEEFKFKKL
ncbi:MAG: sigma-54 dependent transcriptional regulator [Pseudomonadota bacterium]